MAFLLGHCALSFTHSPDPLIIKHGESEEETTLAELCKSTTPECWLNPFLFNGHLQTMWTAVTPHDIPIYYKRKIFHADCEEYSGTFAVDLAVPPYDYTGDVSLPPRTSHFLDSEWDSLAAAPSTSPLVIVLHGLSGGSDEIYLRAVLQPLLAAGFSALVVNSRGCAMSSMTSSVFYNARATWDVRQIVDWAARTWPGRRLYGMGFSFGANILTNYLGEEGEGCQLRAAVVASSPWTLEVSNGALQRTWLGREVYSKTMGSNMKKLVERHADQFSKNARVDVEKVRSITYLHEFDRAFQCPMWGYPTEGAYYRDCSSSDSLLAIRIPLLAIHAEDDPIVNKEAIPFEEFKVNPYTVLLTTTGGGHLAWFELGGTRWLAKPAANFLIKMEEECLEVVKPKEARGSPASNEPGLAGKTAEFMPMRRKLRMPMDS